MRRTHYARLRGPRDDLTASSPLLGLILSDCMVLYCACPQDTEADDLGDRVPQYEMVMEGDLPRFVVASPEYLRRMAEERKTARVVKRKKRKGRWA